MHFIMDLLTKKQWIMAFTCVERIEAAVTVR